VQGALYAADRYTGWGEVGEMAVYSAVRISESSGVRRADINTRTWLWNVGSQTAILWCGRPSKLSDAGTRDQEISSKPVR
jgi:hypothetical protein